MEGLSLGVRKGAWTEEEDLLLKKCIEQHGQGKWHQVPSKAGLNRCRKSCRLRWLNYLKPNIKRGEFEDDEVGLIIRLHKLLGNRWSLIAGRLPGRTANNVKNYWNTHLLKKFKPSNKDSKRKGRFSSSHDQNPATPNDKDNINYNNVTSNHIVINPRPWSLRNKSFLRDNNNGDNNNNNNYLATTSNSCIPSDYQNDETVLWWENLLIDDDNEVLGHHGEQSLDGSVGCFNYCKNLNGVGDNAMLSNNTVDNEEALGDIDQRGISSNNVVDEGNKSSWDQLIFGDVELWNLCYNPLPDNSN